MVMWKWVIRMWERMGGAWIVVGWILGEERERRWKRSRWWNVNLWMNRWKLMLFVGVLVEDGKGDGLKYWQRRWWCLRSVMSKWMCPPKLDVQCELEDGVSNSWMKLKPWETAPLIFKTVSYYIFYFLFNFYLIF